MWNIKSDTFYRVEKTDRKTKNDGAWMNFPVRIPVFIHSQCLPVGFLPQDGGESSTNAYSITGSTPLVDSSDVRTLRHISGTSSLPMDLGFVREKRQYVAV